MRARVTGSLTIRLTEANLLTALRLHYNRIPVKHLIWYFAFCIFLGVAVSIVSGDTSATELFLVAAGMFFWGLFVLIALKFFGSKLWLPRYVRRIFKQQSDFHHDIDVLWDLEYFTSRTPDSFVRTAWKDFYLWDRDHQMIMLYRSESLFNFLPTGNAETCAAADVFETHLLNAGVKRRP